ncbi:MAG: YncE family protein [Candidatus Electrothrix sp. YB6]
MKTIFVLCLFQFFFVTQLPVIALAENVSSIIDWSVSKTWTISSAPSDFSVSFDKKKIFTLEDDQKVHIYADSFNGRRLGTIDVAPGTVAFDIAPRGEMLYLVDSAKNYTAISIDYNKQNDTVANWSVQHTWKTDARPLDIAQSIDKKFAFVLEDDNRVHVYTVAGVKRKIISVSTGTIAIDIPSRKNILCLIDRYRHYMSIHFPRL